MRRSLRTVALLGVVAVAVDGNVAVETRFWDVQGYRGFLAGELEGLSLNREGELLLAPDLVPIPLEDDDLPPQPFLWSAVRDHKGNLYVGSGIGGVVYRVDPRGDASRFFVAPEIEVHALAVDSKDRLLVAASPPGRVYRLTPEGEPTLLFESEERYIWDLVVDRDDAAYIATGERGILFRVKADGSGEEVFDSDEPHLVSLALDADRAVIAGSSGRGLVYRVDRDGTAQVLLDADGVEVAGVAVADSGAIYAGVNTVVPPPEGKERDRDRRDEPEERLAGEMPEGPAPAPGGVDDLARGDDEIALRLRRPRELLKLRSAVYRIDGDGRTSRVWASEEEALHCLVTDRAGRLYFGTGVPGRLYQQDAGAGTPRLVARFPESQVTFVSAGPGDLLHAVMSNPGRLYRATEASGRSGTFLSPVRDAGGRAHWGRVVWRSEAPAGSRVELATRSGNSSHPDGTWSEWSPPYAGSDGSRVLSPPARYLQFRARLSRLGDAPSPRVRAVSISYREENRAPEVSALRLEDQPADSLAGPPPRSRKIVWNATDPNDDEMSHDLDLRREHESDWTPLARGLDAAEYVWDTGAAKPGRYRLRVRTTDEPGNGLETSLTATALSDPFVVDLDPPSIEVLSVSRQGGTARVALRVNDAVSAVVRAEVSAEGLPTRRLQAADGLDDSREERYEFTLDELPAGTKVLHVVAYDRERNRRTIAVPVEGSR